MENKLEITIKEELVDKEPSSSALPETYNHIHIKEEVIKHEIPVAEIKTEITNIAPEPLDIKCDLDSYKSFDTQDRIKVLNYQQPLNTSYKSYIKCDLDSKKSFNTQDVNKVLNYEQSLNTSYNLKYVLSSRIKCDLGSHKSFDTQVVNKVLNYEQPLNTSFNLTTNYVSSHNIKCNLDSDKRFDTQDINKVLNYEQPLNTSYNLNYMPEEHKNWHSSPSSGTLSPRARHLKDGTKRIIPGGSLLPLVCHSFMSALYSCGYCEYKTKNKDYLKTHMWTHMPVLTCNRCEFTTKSSKTLQMHVKMHVPRAT